MNVGADSIGAPSLAEDSVGSSELKADSVGSSEVAGNAVSSQSILDDSIHSWDIAPNAVSSDDLDTVQLRLGDVVTITGNDGQNGDWSTGTSTAYCEPGEELISGSLRWGGETPGDELAISEMDLDTEGTIESVTATGASDTHDYRSMRALAMCLGV